MAKTSGCALSGFVLVKKVPGALHFLAKSPGHSFDYAAMNMSHVVNYLYFGNKPSPRRHQVWCAIMTPAMRCSGALPHSQLDVCMTIRICCKTRESSIISMGALVWNWRECTEAASCLNMQVHQHRRKPVICQAFPMTQIPTSWHITQTCSISLSLYLQALARLHPAGLADDWADKLAGQGFFSRAQKATFEHYMQVCIAYTSHALPHMRAI